MQVHNDHRTKTISLAHSKTAMQRGLLLATLIACGGLMGAASAAAQSNSVATGSAFREQLRLPAGVAWSGVPLRDALECLGRDHRVAIMLDRRIDPSRPVSLTIAQQPLEHVLLTLARHLDLGVCFVDPVVYFGPRETTDKLPTVAALGRREAETLPRATAQRFSRERAWSWPQLSSPRELLLELANEGGMEIVNLDQLPHDLWPAVELPPLPLADRFSLVLAGFGLTWRYAPDGSAIQLVDFPPTAAIVQTYPGKGNARENANRIARLYPEAQVTVEGESIRIVGPWEVHRGVEELMQGRRVSRTVTPPPSRRRTVFTLKVENEPVGGVVKALAEQLHLQVTVDPAAEAKLTERVSFNVADVSREELFQAVLRPAGLKFRLVGDELQILPGE